MGTKLKRPEGPQRPSVPEAPVTAHGTQGKLFIRNQVVVSFGEYARGFIATLRHSRKFPGSRYNSWGPTEASPRLRPRGHLVPLRAVKRGERESASPPRAVTAPSAVPAVTAHGAPAPPTTQARLSRSTSMRQTGDPQSSSSRTTRTSQVLENFRSCEDSELCRFSPKGFKV